MKGEHITYHCHLKVVLSCSCTQDMILTVGEAASSRRPSRPYPRSFSPFPSTRTAAQAAGGPPPPPPSCCRSPPPSSGGRRATTGAAASRARAVRTAAAGAGLATAGAAASHARAGRSAAAAPPRPPSCCCHRWIPPPRSPVWDYQLLDGFCCENHVM